MQEQSNRPALVIYHGGCWDGLAAAWAIRKMEPDAEFRPAYHGNEPPDLKDFVGRRVYVVDFSYPRDVCDTINDVAESLIVLDHHKTAEKELRGAPYAVFDENKSGGRLAWEHLCEKDIKALRGEYRTPWLIDYTEDRDLWRWRLPDSHEINAWLRSYPLDFSVFDTVEKLDHREDLWRIAVAEGKAIIRFSEGLAQAKVKQSETLIVSVPSGVPDWPTLWRVANCTALVSETAQKLAEHATLGCVWFEKPDGSRVYSLRSTRESGCDVSKVAEFFGGGGHKHAAGFTFDHPRRLHPWESINGSDQ